jgi:hypothetical protein
MPIELYDKNALIVAARNAGKPLAFLVGAPLSADEGGGVPNVAEMITVIRTEVESRIPAELDDFDSTIATKSGGAKYQAAMAWLKGRLLTDCVNAVVEKAVLKARKAGSALDCDDDIGEIDGLDGWYLPAGTRDLGRLIAEQGRQFPGPILTTNFDPLLSVAIEVSKGHARWHIEDDNCTIGHSLRRRSGYTDVVHLHGFWRRSDTLHSRSQLTAVRPSLTFALQSLLRQRTLIVAAYGGWDDVFTDALESLLKYGAPEDRMAVNVLWCFREDNPADVEARHGDLLKRMASTRFIAYGGIDCHALFAEIGDFGDGGAAFSGVSPFTSPIAGWDLVDKTYLAGSTPLPDAAVLQFFNGSTPTWSHALCPAIPRRQGVNTVVSRLAQFAAGGDGCSMHLIRAAGGEGKSTLLLQVASDLVRLGPWTVLWKPSPLVALPPEHVLDLDPNRMWLIVADDADNLIENLSTSARLLREAERSNVHFLLASRDTDWISRFGDEPPWESWLTSWVRRNQAITLRGITRDDATAVVKAWEHFGTDGLGHLATIENSDLRVDALVDEVRSESLLHSTRRGRHRTLEGSFFGGLLSLRFGPEGLHAHVRSLLDRLRHETIRHSDQTLFDALVYVAACHSGGIPGLDENVLADLLDVPRHWVHDLVVQRLGEEAAGVSSGGHVFTRHRKVADAIVVEADEMVDISSVWNSVVRQTLRTAREVRIGGGSFAAIVFAGPRLVEELPEKVAPNRRAEIALSAATAAVDNQPTWLGCVTSLGKTYRVVGSPNLAAKMFRSTLGEAGNKIDYATHIRGYWHEWGVSEGLLATQPGFRAADAWLQGLSLSDYLGSAPITQEQAKQSLTSLGIAFGILAEPTSDHPFNLGRRSAAYLGYLTDPDPDTAATIEWINREADRTRTPHPRDYEESILWLRTAVVRAANELDDPFLKGLARPEELSFQQLSDSFGRIVPEAAAISSSGQIYTEPVQEGDQAEDLRYEVWQLLRDLIQASEAERRQLYVAAVGLELGKRFSEVKPVHRHLGFETLTELIHSFGDFAVTGEHPKWRVGYRVGEESVVGGDLRYEVWALINNLIDRHIVNDRPLYLPTIGIELTRRFPGTTPVHNLGFETLGDMVRSFDDFVITGEHPKWIVQYRQEKQPASGGDLRQGVRLVISDLLDKSVADRRSLPLPVVGLELARRLPEARPVHANLGFSSLIDLIASFDIFVVTGAHPRWVVEYRDQPLPVSAESLRYDTQQAIDGLIDHAFAEQRPLYLPSVGAVLKARFPKAHPIHHTLGFATLTELILSFSEYIITGEHPRWVVHYGTQPVVDGCETPNEKIE